jgi:hypothetical protein
VPDQILTSQRQIASEFVRAKGRMPENELEFVDWLLEFDAAMGNALNLILDNYDQHMALCTGILELPRGRVS